MPDQLPHARQDAARPGVIGRRVRVLGGVRIWDALELLLTRAPDLTLEVAVEALATGSDGRHAPTIDGRRREVSWCARGLSAGGGPRSHAA